MIGFETPAPATPWTATNPAILAQPASTLASKIKRREITCTQLVTASLTRAHEINPALNAFCHIFDDEALYLAGVADAAVAKGEAVGPLHGVPIAVKDLTPTKGHPTSNGSWAFPDWVPDHTALCIERLQSAGVIIIGKTTTPEFAFSAFTRSPRWGITRNPWDPSKTSGGSSGGSAVAVATGCVPFAEGTDMGGSIRIPAACCGVVGFKPSLGRIPMTILPSVFDNISHFGPLARSVDDAAMFLSAAAGPSSQDIQSNTAAFSISKTKARNLKGCRFALSVDQGYYRVHPDVLAAVQATVEMLRSAGAIVEEVHLPWTRANNDLWYDYWCVFMATFFGHLLENYRDVMDPAVVEGIVHGGKLTAVQHKRIELLRTRIWVEFARISDRYDFFLTPTCSIPAPSADLSDSDFLGNTPTGQYEGFEMTLAFNLLSACPVISLPIGKSSEGLPIGLQVVGQRFADEALIGICRQIERQLFATSLWRPPL